MKQQSGEGETEGADESWVEHRRGPRWSFVGGAGSACGKNADLSQRTRPALPASPTEPRPGVPLSVTRLRPGLQTFCDLGQGVAETEIDKFSHPLGSALGREKLVLGGSSTRSRGRPQGN